MQDGAAVNNDKLVSAVVFIDGTQVDDVRTFRVRSKGCFQLFADDPNDDGDQKIMAASDGYWLLIAPLPGGRHTIRIGANYGSKEEAYGHKIQNFEYELWIGGEGRVSFAPSTPANHRHLPSIDAALTKVVNSNEDDFAKSLKPRVAIGTPTICRDAQAARTGIGNR